MKPLNQHTMQTVVRHFHLAFQKMEVEEIYDVLVEQLIKAVHKYDPDYTGKVKEVVEKIGEISGQPFNVAQLNRHLEFDSHRYIRLLCRHGFLAPVFGRDRKVAGYKHGPHWPVPAEFFQKGPIGFVDYLQTWIEERMPERKNLPGRRIISRRRPVRPRPRPGTIRCRHTVRRS